MIDKYLEYPSPSVLLNLTISVLSFFLILFLSDGKKLKSSRNKQDHQEGPCKHKLKRKLMKIKFFSRLLVHGVPMFRVKHMPTCDEDGFYAPKQCLTDQSECWCVDRLGNKIESSGERHRPEELDCS